MANVVAGNYRPISVLPAISKIMEKILYDQLYRHLSKFRLFSDSQFGFRKFHSTATGLLDCTNDWYVNLDKKMFNLVVQIELKQDACTGVHSACRREENGHNLDICVLRHLRLRQGQMQGFLGLKVGGGS